jgi:hypothetical protein
MYYLNKFCDPKGSSTRNSERFFLIVVNLIRSLLVWLAKEIIKVVISLSVKIGI